MELPTAIVNILVKALDLWTTPVLSFGVRQGRLHVEIFPETAPRESIDQRIEKIEAARRNLSEALEAIDELKIAAETNKAELATALERLSRAQTERAAAERELQAVRGIAQSDIDVFRKPAGVPSKTEIAKERLIGFIVGILASVLASAIWWLAAKLWPLLRS